MQKLWQAITGAALALVALSAVGCSAPNIPMQPATGVVKDYRTASPTAVVRSLTTQATANAQPKKVNVYADGMVAVTGLPHFQQGNDRTCAQSNIASLMNYWGKDASYQGVVKEMNPSNLPTDVNNVTKYLRGKGLAAQDYRLATLNFLKKQINEGKPTLVLMDFGSLATEHYVTIKGYNEKTRELLYNDPVDGPNMLVSYEAFENMWQNRSLAAVPGFGAKYNRIAFDVAVK